MMNLAHYFTLFRIILIPFFPIIFIGYSVLGIPEMLVPIILLIILGICEFTDAIDGVIARKKNQVTDLGKVLDPLADSVMRLSVFLTFTQKPIEIPLLLVLVFVYRDALINAMRILFALKGSAMAARKSGKIKAILQAVVSFAILILMVFYSYGKITLSTFRVVSIVLMSIAAVYTVASAVEYFYANMASLKRSFKS